MKHTEYKRGASKASFVQAVLLIAILVIGYLGYGVLKRGNLGAGLSSFINMDVENMRPLQAMPDEKKTELQKTFSGFWVNETADSSAPVRKYDCLELKDNGIIWQVITWRIRYPGGDTTTVYHIRYGYLNPYSFTGNGKNIVCEVRTIRQVYINGNDTCFGASQVDELWETRRESDAQLVMNRKRYAPYQGELTALFPPGMIDLVDKFIARDCSHTFSIAEIIKEKLMTDCKTVSADNAFDTLRLGSILTEYFGPAYMEELFASLPYYPSLPDSIVVPVAVSEKGTLQVTLSKGKEAQAGHFEGIIFKELETWPVAPATQSAHGDLHHPLMHFVVRIPQP